MHVTTKPTQTFKIKIMPPLKIAPGSPNGITECIPLAPVKNEYVLHPQYVNKDSEVITLKDFCLKNLSELLKPNAIE